MMTFSLIIHFPQVYFFLSIFHNVIIWRMIWQVKSHTMSVCCADISLVLFCSKDKIVAISLHTELLERPGRQRDAAGLSAHLPVQPCITGRNTEFRCGGTKQTETLTHEILILQISIKKKGNAAVFSPGSNSISNHVYRNEQYNSLKSIKWIIKW